MEIRFPFAIQPQSQNGPIILILLLFLFAVAICIWVLWWKSLTPEQQQEWLKKQKEAAAQREFQAYERKNGKYNSSLTCPHCHAVGKIRTKEVNRTENVMLLTGWSIFSVTTGGIRKGKAIRCLCENCKMVWHVA